MLPNSAHRFGWYLKPAYDYSFPGTINNRPGSALGCSLVFVERP
jgi:hypothetical protein